MMRSPADGGRSPGSTPAGLLIIACLTAGFGCGSGRSPGSRGGGALGGPDGEAAAQPAAAGPAAPVAADAPAPSPLPSTRVRDLSFDDVKLEMEKGDAFSPELIPKRVTALDGTRIRIRGYILPSFQQTGLTQFVLVRDNMECCFGPGAMLHDCIVVRMQPGRTAAFSVRPVAVTGTFRLEELRAPDGTHLAIYAMEGETVN
jgi:hypothetical protein